MALTLTLLWANSAGQTCYFRTVGGIQTGPVAGVQSCYSGDVDNYDEENYRDSYTQLIASLQGNVGGADSATLLATAGPASAITKGTPDTAAPSAAVITGLFSTSDEVMHIPPRPELKKRTMLFFYNAATSAGSVVFSCWADEYIGLSTSAFTYI